jgi:hypothetical protein
MFEREFPGTSSNEVDVEEVDDENKKDLLATVLSPFIYSFSSSEAFL